MRLRAVLIVLVTCAAAGVLAAEKEPLWPARYWAVPVGATEAKCTPGPRREADVQGFVERQLGLRCEKAEKEDHLLFTCGEKLMVVAYSRESCLMWTKRKLSEQETARQVAFDGCLTTALKQRPLDQALPYCMCVGTHIALMGEAALEQMPKEQLRRYLSETGKQCNAETGGDGES